MNDETLRGILRQAKDDFDPRLEPYIQARCLGILLHHADPELYTRFWDEWENDTEWAVAFVRRGRNGRNATAQVEARIAEAVRQAHLTQEEKDAELLAAAAELGIDIDPAHLRGQRADGPEEVEAV